MITKIRSDRIITPDGLIDGAVYIEGGAVIAVGDMELQHDCEVVAMGKYVSPGFIEMHTHGGDGNAFLTADADEVARGCDFHLKHGVTTILPTVSAAPFETMRAAAVAIKEAKDKGLSRANILGAHLEGPYLSDKQSGAQCPDFITPPKREEYEALVGELPGAVARWTYAPENDEGGEFASYIANNGLLLSAGHTDAKYSDMDCAISHGCKLITHLYSCTSTVTRAGGFRSLGVIESAFLRDELFVELIADGKHLPRELVQMIVKIKGDDKVALITDSLDIAGTDIREGVMSGVGFIVEDGVCKLRDRSAFAGSVATATTLLRFGAVECGFGVLRTVKMMSEVPAKLLGLNKGKLAPGCDADIVIFGDNLEVDSVYVGGALAHKA